MIVIKLNESKLDSAHKFQGKAGNYIDLVLMENRDGPDQYGNDGFVVQGVSKEAKERGERGPIVGNWRNVVTKAKATAAVAKATQNPPTTTNQDDVPF